MTHCLTLKMGIGVSVPCASVKGKYIRIKSTNLVKLVDNPSKVGAVGGPEVPTKESRDQAQ